MGVSKLLWEFHLDFEIPLEQSDLHLKRYLKKDYIYFR